MTTRRWVIVCPDEAVCSAVEETLGRQAVAVLDRTGERALLIEAGEEVMVDLKRDFPGLLVAPERAGYQPG